MSDDDHVTRIILTMPMAEAILSAEANMDSEGLEVHPMSLVASLADRDAVREHWALLVAAARKKVGL